MFGSVMKVSFKILLVMFAGVMGAGSLGLGLLWSLASRPELMSVCSIDATEPEEHGDFRWWQPLQLFEWESAELELNCREVQRTVDVRVKEMIPFLRPINQQWTMAHILGEEWFNDFSEVRSKDSDPIDHLKLGHFIDKHKLECRYSPISIFPWASEGIVKCRTGSGNWHFFHSALDDSSKR